MPTPAESSPCPACGAPRRSDEPCPRCLLQLGLSHAVGTSAESRPAPPTPAEIARHFPGLEIEAVIGQGGMGVVYRARQKKLGRAVALKLLAPELAGDPAFAERFLREARAMARLEHANIVAVHDFGETDGLCWILMEHVEGVNLRQALAAGEITPARALAIVPQLCAALQAAHELGVVHRDIKPENVLLGVDGSVKIADFGLAKLTGPGGPEAALTRTDAAMGTLHYMAPEQLVGAREVDHRADIYSLGVVFYEMLTGELPLGRFEPPSQRAAVASGVDEIVMRTLERAPEKRYQAAVEVQTDVEGLGTKAHTPPSARSMDGGMLVYARALAVLCVPPVARVLLDLPVGLLWNTLYLALWLTWAGFAFVQRDRRLALATWSSREFRLRFGGFALLACGPILAIQYGLIASWEEGTADYVAITGPKYLEQGPQGLTRVFASADQPEMPRSYLPFLRVHPVDGRGNLLAGMVFLSAACFALACRKGATSLLVLFGVPTLALGTLAYARWSFDGKEVQPFLVPLQGTLELEEDLVATREALEEVWRSSGYEVVYRAGGGDELQVLAVQPRQWNERWELTKDGPRRTGPGIAFALHGPSGSRQSRVDWSAGWLPPEDPRAVTWRAEVERQLRRARQQLEGS